MDFKKLFSKSKDILEVVAPTIATAMAGPLAGSAVSVLSNVLLGHDKGTEAEIFTALSTATPETLLKLKEADNAFAIKWKELDVQDRANARDREKVLKDTTPRNIAYILVIGFIGTLVMLFFVPIPDQNKALVFTMLGALGTLAIGACQYYHGSSSGSADKSGTIERLKGVSG